MDYFKNERYHKRTSEMKRFTFPLLLYFTAALIIFLTGYLYYKNNLKIIREETGKQLEALASLKSDEITRWMQERKGDITFYQTNESFVSVVKSFLSKEPGSEEAVKNWLSKTQETHKYDIFILTSNYDIHLILAEDTTKSFAVLSNAVKKATRLKKTYFTGIYRHPETNKLFFSTVAPIIFEGETEARAFLFFRSDVQNKLLKEIKKPTRLNQRTEFSLIGNEGDSLFFVNENKYSDINLIKSDKDLPDEEAPMVQAAKGKSGLLEGLDSNGEKILAYVKHLHDSEWSLVVHIKERYIEKPLQGNKLWIFVFIILTIAMFISWHLIFAQREKTRNLNEKLVLTDQIAKNRELLESIIQLSPLSIVVISDNNSIKVWNRAAGETFGIDISERTSDFNPIFGIDDMDEFQVILDHFRRKNDTFTYDTTRRKKDGQLIDLQVWVSKISKTTEGGSQFLMIFEDSTERKKFINEISELNRDLEQRVRERTIQYEELNKLLKEENQFRLESENAIKRYALEVEDLYNNAPCGYHSLDSSGIFRKVNDTELKWLGVSRDEIIDKKSIREFLSDDSKKTFDINFPRIFTEGNVSEVELDLLTANGNVISVLLSSSAIYDENHKFVMTRSTLFDISELKTSQHKIEELNKSLTDRANQLELVNKELESFTYSVSHDLKSPLRSIQGFTDIIESDHSQEMSEETLRLFNVIKKNAKRMDMLIQDLLDLSKVTRLELKRVPLDMRQIILGILENDFSNLDTSKVEIEIAQLHVAKGDTVLIQQVWLNLLSNAIKYSRQEEVSKIRIESKQTKDCVEYSISDNGVGFNPLYKHKLFGTFQRLHSNNEFEGTGVGLAIVKRIINRHGGHVWAESQEGEGATFYFNLPVEQI